MSERDTLLPQVTVPWFVRVADLTPIAWVAAALVERLVDSVL